MRFRGHYTTGLILDQSLIFLHRAIANLFITGIVFHAPLEREPTKIEFPLICFWSHRPQAPQPGDSMRSRARFLRTTPIAMRRLTSRRPTNASAPGEEPKFSLPRSYPGIAPFKNWQGSDQQSKKRIPVIQFLLDTHNGLILNRNMQRCSGRVALLTSKATRAGKCSNKGSQDWLEARISASANSDEAVNAKL